MAPRIGAFHILLLLQTIASLYTYSSGERNDDTIFDRKETRGNRTFGCSSSGPCSPCSYSEKSDDETYHCSTSGYRQSYRCVELGSNGLNGHISKAKTAYHEKGGTGGSSSKKTSDRVLQEDNAKEVSYGLLGRKVFEAEDVATHDGHQVLHVYYSCLPTNTDEKLSVLGFEGIVLGLLAMSAPLIYHRRRRNFAMSGMTRLPTSARF